MANDPLDPEVPPPGTPPPPPPEGDDDLDPAPGGDPVKALHAERGKRKESARALKAAQDELARIKPMADEYATILPVLPELLARAQTPPSQPPPQNVDPDIVELAQDLGMVDDNGELDIPRATRLMQRLDQRSGRMVQAHTQPIRQNSAQAVASQVREKAYKAVDQQGQPYATRAAIDQVFNSLPPESLTDPNTAVMALVIARGLGGPGADADEPLHIEGQGRANGRVAPLTQMERSIMKMRGKSESEWRKLTPEETTSWELEDQ